MMQSDPMPSPYTSRVGDAAEKPAAPIGRLVAVSGSQSVVLLYESDEEQGIVVRPPEMGTLLKIETPKAVVVGLVSALSVPVPASDATEQEIRVVEIEFVGELRKGASAHDQSFRRGVSNYPSIGHEAFHVTSLDLSRVYACNADTSIRVGTIVQEASIPAMVNGDDLLGKHFAILGSTGTGKSCATALLLRNILEKSPHAHVVLLDPHREYSPAFGNLAEVVTADNLDLPFWLLTFEEMVEVVITHQANREVDIEILRELIPIAKSRYGQNQRRGELRAALARGENEPAASSVDTPVPYRISDLIGLLDEHIGKLDLRGELAPFKRLKARIEAVSHDPRFAFMFGNLTVQDTMAEILGRLFRVPVNGKPITIIELAGLPSEVINVVVSVLSRMSFDLAQWSNGELPITLVCEEAHRYAPQDTSLGFEPAKRALSRIAKEGRKYGVSLCIVSQRPAELDATILSQCNTIFGMRLPNERDQEILRARVSDSSASLLEVLPSLGTGEAVAFGEGVALPTRIRFDALPADAMPRSATAQFSKIWQKDVGEPDFLHNIVTRWRAKYRTAHHSVAAQPNETAAPAPVSAISGVALAEASAAAALQETGAAVAEPPPFRPALEPSAEQASFAAPEPQDAQRSRVSSLQRIIREKLSEGQS
jgi:hypothetical protein